MMKNKHDFDKYDAEIEDVDELAGTDVKINPDYYIHSAVLLAQRALADPDLKVGLLRFRMAVEHIEILCKASNMVDDVYAKEVDEWEKEQAEKWKNISDTEKSTKLANKKLELLMRSTFAHKVSTSPLKG